MTTMEALVAGAIRSHNTDTSDGDWNAEEARRRLPSESGALREAHAYVDADGNPDAKTRHKLLHHEVSADGTVGPASMAACLHGIHALNRADSSVPAGERAGVYAHLRNHLLSGGRPEHTIPALKDKAEASVEGAVTAAAGGGGENEGEGEPEIAESGAPMQDGQGVRYRRWRMPVAVVEGVETGDMREIDAEALTWREFPRPVMVLTSTTEGHDDAELVGRIDTAERVDASKMTDPRTGKPYGEGAWAIQLEGVLTSEELADRTVDLIDGGFLRSVSVDMSDVTSVLELVAADGNVIDVDGADEETLLNARLKERVTAGRIMGVTILPFEAFEVAYIEMVDDEGNTGPATRPGDGTAKRPAAVRASGEAPNPRRCLPCESDGLVASVAPVEPTRAWFERPTGNVGRSVNITDEGRVFGLVAPEGVCHTGILGECVTVPHSATDYAWFHLSSVKTAEGDVIPSGVITVDTGHASTARSVGAVAAMAHYDNTGTAVADVVVGEDERGIWFSGALRPDATPEQIRKLRGSKLSGDWRPVHGNRELVAVLAVNTPGFPVVRQLVASGQPGALIASFGALSLGPSAVPELDELHGLLPDLRAAADRERGIRGAEAGDVRNRMRVSRAGVLRAGMVS